MADEIEFPVGLTERGKLVHAGYAALAVDGDDTLTAPDETDPAPGPGDLGAVPDTSADPAGAGSPIETADDASAVDRETRDA